MFPVRFLPVPVIPPCRLPGFGRVQGIRISPGPGFLLGDMHSPIGLSRRCVLYLSHGIHIHLLGYLGRRGVPALSGIDTRALVRRLRDRGAMRGVVTSEVGELDRLAAELERFPTMAGRALVDEVTCEAPYEVPATEADGPGAGAHVAVYDFGAKASIAASLARRGARVSVLPARTPAERCLALGVDGVVPSNGPGDPEPLVEMVAIVRRLVEAGLPVFGICLGHQLLALALGGRTFKLKFGHHGGNQPGVDLATGKVVWKERAPATGSAAVLYADGHVADYEN